MLKNQIDSKDDSFLVKELTSGNVLAFNALFRKYGTRLYRFANGYLKSQEEAEELVQEVFTRIWERRGDLKEELSFKSYLFMIAFNIIRKHFKTQARISEYLRSGISDLDMQTTDNITYNSLNQYINQLVDHLPDRRRTIFIKSRYEGLSVREIADELKISHKTVENQLTSALKFIRTNLNKEAISVTLFSVLFIL